MNFMPSLACMVVLFGTVSSVNLIRLEKSIGVNLEERRLRLEKLGDYLQTVDNGSKDTVKVASVEKDFIEGAESIVELSRKSGLSKYLFQADMNLNEYQLENLERSLRREKSGHTRSKRQAERFAHRWTNGTVNYYLDSAIGWFNNNRMNDERKTASIKHSMDYLEANTCIRFVKNEYATNRIKFISERRNCWSMIGMQCEEQELSIGDGCESMGTVFHELMHALGFIHTHSRPDRDNYVQINHDNIQRYDWRNFIRYPDEEIITYTPYEYGSIMHYGADAYNITNDIPAMFAIDQKYLYTMGGDIISFWDILMINEDYGCSVKCTAKNSAECLNDGVPNPNNCSKCICPLGYGGDLCDQKPAGCGTVFEAQTTWMTKTIDVGNNNYTGVLNDQFTFCHYWITAPEEGQIQVVLDPEMTNSACRYGCSVNGVEFKVNREKQKTNPITEQSNKTTDLPIKPASTTEVPHHSIFTTGSPLKPEIITDMPRKTSTLATPTDRACYDVWDTDICERLIETVDCEYADVSQKCTRTCGGCSVAKPTSKDSTICRNELTDPTCEGFARMGMCTQFLHKCLKSCHQCEEKHIFNA